MKLSIKMVIAGLLVAFAPFAFIKRQAFLGVMLLGGGIYMYKKECDEYAKKEIYEEVMQG